MCERPPTSFIVCIGIIRKQQFLTLAALTQRHRARASVAASTRLPIIMDADTGFGAIENAARTVRELAAGGTTVVVVEHDLNVIWNYCERVLFMAEGKITLTGDPAEIREHHTVIEKYLGEGHV